MLVSLQPLLRSAVAVSGLAPPRVLYAARALSMGVDYATVFNVPEGIDSKVGRNLFMKSTHPICQMKERIFAHFRSLGVIDTIRDVPGPVVSVADCFDRLLVPADHDSRRLSNNYYVNRDVCLRPHMTAHLYPLLSSKDCQSYIIAGDCYRRDTIDQSHYPVFHQIDGARLLPMGASEEDCVADLKRSLGGMVQSVFGAVELEIFYRERWLEVLGCGLIRREILKSCSREGRLGWAFGMGIDRLAMVLHQIPDIRLFWSADERFLQQFRGAPSASGPVQFAPFSSYPPVPRDLSFWVKDGRSFDENDLANLVRGTAGDLCESIAEIDKFVHPKTRRESRCYRIVYRSMERSLTNALHGVVRGSLAPLGLELR